MSRITISEELEKKLNLIKNNSWSLKYDRGLDTTVAFLVNDYETKKTIEEQLIIFRREINESISESVEKGIIESLKKWILNIISFAKPDS